MKSRFVKLLVWGLIACVVLAAAGYGGYRGYKPWRQKRFVMQAREFLLKGEERKALISVQRAIRAKPSDVEALRLMAGIVEREQSPAAVVWRQRVVDQAPASVADRLSLAQVAAVFRDFSVATNALSGVREVDRNTAEFRNVAGAVASLMGQLDEAEMHFMEAVRLNAVDPSLQLNLSVVRLQRSNSVNVASARSSLDAITKTSTNSSIRCRAQRELVHDALRTGLTNLAMVRVDALLREPESVFTDRLLRLDVLRANAVTNAVEEIALARVVATNGIPSIIQMLAWEMKTIHPKRTLEWIETLPGEARTNVPVLLSESELRAATEDWRRLADDLERQSWGALDFLRHGMRFLALRRLNLNDGAGVEWGLALKATGSELGPLNLLLESAARWRMPNEMREILDLIVSRHPKEEWAGKMLAQNLYNEGQTRPLLSLLNRLSTVSPGDMTLKNNVAMTAMLLEAHELRPHELARQVFDASPTNRAFVSSYAFSLHLQGRNEEALKVIERLAPDQLEVPGIAGYYALILKANGKRQEAKRYFDLAKGEKMLPEERKLMDRARAEL